MATDYDTPRRTRPDEPDEESLDELQLRRGSTRSAAVDSTSTNPTQPSRSNYPAQICPERN